MIFLRAKTGIYTKKTGSLQVNEQLPGTVIHSSELVTK